MSTTKRSAVTPRIIIHGGSGNITRENLSAAQWAQYRAALLSILRSTYGLLSSNPSTSTPTTALDAAVHAVRLLEENPLFNCGRGAVFTRAGHVELEASVMVSRGFRKRGVGVSMLRHVKSPIELAAEMLRRGEEDGGGGAQGHVHVSGEEGERLAKGWGIEMCEESWFWTRRRWEEHRRGLEREKKGRSAEKWVEWEEPWDGLDASACLRPDGETWSDNDPSWDGHSYLPQGTVGCVVLDSTGTLAVATSTGGLTNKLPGRIGDTPTHGAGFWVEEWAVPSPSSSLLCQGSRPFILQLVDHLIGRLELPTFLRECLPQLPSYTSISANPASSSFEAPPRTEMRAVALGGTGNGDNFLQLAAVRTVASLVRFSPASSAISLASAVTWMAGPGGELQRAAGERWGKTGEGLGGIIGIEVREGKGEVVADFNMGMFRAWVDGEGRERCMVFREDY